MTGTGTVIGGPFRRTNAEGILVPATGIVEFRSAVKYVMTPGGSVAPGREKVLLDENGEFSIELTATDIGNPMNWTWEVLFGIAGFGGPPTNILVPTGSVVNVNTAIPVASSDGTPVIVGPPGPPGPPGPSGGVYVHTQAAPAASWPITHNLSKFPSVVLVLDSAPDEPVYTDVHYTSESALVVEWPSPEAGKAYCN